jgi:TetR/AcrR family fatty acid metabolism transcriptional regulator
MNRHSVAQRKPGASPTRPPGDRADKRARILEAAVRVFANRGFFGARVAEIARAAGVADGTIYLYFKSKDDLLICLFEDRMRRILAALKTALADHERPLDRLRCAILQHLDLVEQDRALVEVLTVELRQSAKFMREYRNPPFAEFLQVIESIVAQGQRDGSIRRGPSPTLIARALFGALDELSLARALRLCDPLPKADIAKFLLDGIACTGDDIAPRRHVR